MRKIIHKWETFKTENFPQKMFGKFTPRSNGGMLIDDAKQKDKRFHSELITGRKVTVLAQVKTLEKHCSWWQLAAVAPLIFLASFVHICEFFNRINFIDNIGFLMIFHFGLKAVLLEELS